MGWVYLVLAGVGLVSTWTYNIAAMTELGDGFTPAAFIRVGFEGSPLLGSLAADFWVGSLASLLWMMVEGRRLRMKRMWAYLVLTFAVAWAFSLPLFLAVREWQLKRLEGGRRGEGDE